MLCGNCGKELRAGSLFCPHCGTVVGPEFDLGYEQGYDVVTIESNRGAERIIMIVSTIVIVMGLITGGIWYCLLKTDSAPKETKAPPTTTAEAKSASSDKAAAPEVNYIPDEGLTFEEKSTPDQASDEDYDGYDQDTEDYGGPGIVFPNSSYELIDSSEFWGLSRDTLQDAVNEIYARHGYAFSKHPEIREKYKSYDWYDPEYDSMEYVQSQFNSIEQQNVDAMAAARNGGSV